MSPNRQAEGLLKSLGGEVGCRQLSAEFYSRVAKDPVLRPLFPGKSLRCATEEFAAFLIQFLHGDEEQTQFRWWLSLRESHSRFQISSAQRTAWLKQMEATLCAAPIEESTRQSLNDFFQQTSKYVMGADFAEPKDPSLAACWNEQQRLDQTISAIAAGGDQEVIALLPQFVSRPSVLVGLMARMIQSGRTIFIDHVISHLEQNPNYCGHISNGRTLLHSASAYGSLKVVEVLLRLGANPNALDAGSHAPLYSVANECSLTDGPDIVRRLVQAGADVDACGGVTRATALHMAARRGFVEIARTLIECGAALNAKDRKGDTPLSRAMNCRQKEMTRFLIDLGAPIS